MSDTGVAIAAVKSWVGMFKGLEKAVEVLSALEGLEAGIAGKIREAEALTVEISRLSAKRDSVSTEFSDRKKSSDEEFARVKADIDSRKESLRGELRGLIAEVNEKKSTAEDELSLQLVQLASARSALSIAKAEYAAIQSEISSLKRKFG